ncbi:MAG TPA: hypothetical protein VFX86_02700 [Candidatus Saccharimonadales bacterium]|nr:hypothetical protein [Candidatus Saccharimonadales bacterium]
MKLVKKHKNKNLDQLTYFIGFMIPILTIPQTYNVIISKQTLGVSLATWSFYLFASLLFAWFGIVHKEKLLIITYVPLAILEILIVVGLILY